MVVVVVVVVAVAVVDCIPSTTIKTPSRTKLLAKMPICNRNIGRPVHDTPTTKETTATAVT